MIILGLIITLISILISGPLILMGRISNICRSPNCEAERIFVIMRLRRRAFVDKLDFLTSPGHLGGGKAREELGLPGPGPHMVITDRCAFGFDESSREMVLKSLHPGAELDEVQAEVSWELNIDPDLGTTQAPTEQELRLLREELDPQGVYR